MNKWAYSLQEPARTESGEGGAFAGTAAVLQLRLLEVYLALPFASSFSKEHEVLVKLCSRSLRVTAGTVKTGQHFHPTEFIFYNHSRTIFS